ncbi:MAG: IS200/IS605 family transposase [Paludibacter sp.]|nr:IS200/IS605 family transposase [Paludibacter sp.]MDD4427460.1 IS200/IS605 family transposase [Paludibacter sp.]
MSQSLSKLYVHIVFHTKKNQNLINQDIEKELYAYLGGILKSTKSVPIAINGIENHIHILCIISKNISLADLLEELKRNSSRWIKSKGVDYNDFAWQGGYGGFSVSQSKVNTVKTYIENQKEHHRTVSFKEEYILFLKEYGIDYNEDYLWT